MALAVYKPRNPRKSPLFRLLESLYDTVKGVWEERFESPYGFWRGRWDDVVARFLGLRRLEFRLRPRALWDVCRDL